MRSTTPEAPLALPLEGAEARGSKPVGLDGTRNGRVSRPGGQQGPLADRRSRIRGGCLTTTLLATAVAMRTEH